MARQNSWQRTSHPRSPTSRRSQPASTSRETTENSVQLPSISELFGGDVLESGLPVLWQLDEGRAAGSDTPRAILPIPTDGRPTARYHPYQSQRQPSYWAPSSPRAIRHSRLPRHNFQHTHLVGYDRSSVLEPQLLGPLHYHLPSTPPPTCRSSHLWSSGSLYQQLDILRDDAPQFAYEPPSQAAALSPLPDAATPAQHSHYTRHSPPVEQSSVYIQDVWDAGSTAQPPIWESVPPPWLPSPGPSAASSTTAPIDPSPPFYSPTSASDLPHASSSVSSTLPVLDQRTAFHPSTSTSYPIPYRQTVLHEAWTPENTEEDEGDFNNTSGDDEMVATITKTRRTWEHREVNAIEHALAALERDNPEFKWAEANCAEQDHALKHVHDMCVKRYGRRWKRSWRGLLQWASTNLGKKSVRCPNGKQDAHSGDSDVASPAGLSSSATTAVSLSTAGPSSLTSPSSTPSANSIVAPVPSPEPSVAAPLRPRKRVRKKKAPLRNFFQPRPDDW